MKYSELERNRVVSSYPQKLFSDDFDENGECLLDEDGNCMFNTRKYISEYDDGAYYGELNTGWYSNIPLHAGFHEIMFKVGEKIVDWREYNEYCLSRAHDNKRR